MRKIFGITSLVGWLAVATLSAQTLEERYRSPADWLSYDRDNTARRYSPLDQIDTGNADRLQAAWAYQWPRLPSRSETTPLVRDGVMYLTVGGEEAVALDARSGAVIWELVYTPEEEEGRTNWNRGFAISGDRLVMATSDARLLAVDARTGSLLWKIVVGDVQSRYGTTAAPIIVKDKVLIGVRGGDTGMVQGYLDAYNVETGKLEWRHRTVPRPGEPGHETWPQDNDSWKVGGAATWTSGAYDPDLDLVYWPTGNPGPDDFDASNRDGDNLYSNSVVAINPDTGERVWHYQFTPRDNHDWDANETPVLIDAVWHGRPRKLLAHADRNGFFYVLDRENGEFLLGEAFAKQDWNLGFTPEGRPKVRPGIDPTPKGVKTCPDIHGGTNWQSPAYNPETGLFYVIARDGCQFYYPTGVAFDPEDPPARHFLRALDVQDGSLRWEIPIVDPGHIIHAGAMTTGGGLVFFGTRQGRLIAADAESGKILWNFNTGGTIRANPMTYAVDGKQYVAIVTRSAVFSFALDPRR